VSCERAVFGDGETVTPISRIYGTGVDADVVLLQRNVLPEFLFDLKMFGFTSFTIPICMSIIYLVTV
jgi:hypothetical protein